MVWPENMCLAFADLWVQYSAAEVAGAGWNDLWNSNTQAEKSCPPKWGRKKMMGLSQAYPHIACRQMWSRAGPEGYKSSICVELGHHGSRLWLRHCHLVTHQCWASSRPTRGLFVLCWWLAMLVTSQTERVSLASLPSALRPALLFCYTRS